MSACFDDFCVSSVLDGFLYPAEVPNIHVRFEQ